MSQSDRPALPQPLDPGAFRAMQDQSRLVESLQVVFIVGPQRTGTTWLVQALNGHPNAVARCESRIMSRLLDQFAKDVREFNEERPEGHPYLRLSELDIAMLQRQAIDRQLSSYVASRHPYWTEPLQAVIDKSPDHARFVDRLAALYPWAKFICCTRDVRDAAVSQWFLRKHYGKLGPDDSMENMARWFAKQIFGPAVTAARRAGARLGPERYTELSYEAHKAAPEREVDRILRFIGLPSSPEIARACVQAGDFERASGGRAPGTEADSFYRKGIVGDWRNHYSPELGDELLRLAGESPAPVPVSA